MVPAALHGGRQGLEPAQRPDPAVQGRAGGGSSASFHSAAPGSGGPACGGAERLAAAAARPAVAAVHLAAVN